MRPPQELLYDSEASFRLVDNAIEELSVTDADSDGEAKAALQHVMTRPGIAVLSEALFRAYFIDGRDVGDRAVLTEIAATCGMDSELVADLLESDADVDLVERESKLAGEMGIQGVPAFIIDNRFMMVGAQDAAVLLRVIDKAQTMRGEQAPADQQTS